MGRTPEGILTGRFDPFGCRIEPNVGMGDLHLLPASLILCALSTTGLFSIFPAGTTAPGVSICVCRIGLEMSIFLSAALSMTLALFRDNESVASCFLSFDFKNEAIRFKALLFKGFFVVSGTTTGFGTASEVDNGRCTSCTGTTGAGRSGIFGAFFKGDSNSFAVHVEFSRIGDDMIGLGCDPGFNGGNAGATDVEFTDCTATLMEFGLHDAALARGLLTFAFVALRTVLVRVTFDLGLRVAEGSVSIGGAVGLTASAFFGEIVKPLNWPKNSFWSGDVCSSARSE